jgi:hypothetical protein
MEKITFEDDIFLYKTKIDSYDFQKAVLNECNTFLLDKTSKRDNYSFYGGSFFDLKKDFISKTFMEEAVKMCLLECTNLAKKDNIKFNIVHFGSWINVVKRGNPKQRNFKKNDEVSLHNHVDLQKNDGLFYPKYTFVYYLQMPDNLENNEGTLIIGGKEDRRYYIMPEVSDLIIMDGKLEHSPNKSPNSTKDRIVIAGNVGFEYVKEKVSLI